MKSLLDGVPPRAKARTAGIFYLLTFVAGSLALLVHTTIGSVAGLIAAMSYVAVTVLFYDLFKPVHQRLSLAAALVESSFPYNLAPGIVGEGVLTLWLLFAGVDVRRWNEQAGTVPLRGRTA